jgi:hypothetical protein
MLPWTSRVMGEATGIAKPIEQCVAERLYFATSGMLAYAPLLLPGAHSRHRPSDAVPGLAMRPRRRATGIHHERADQLER